MSNRPSGVTIQISGKRVLPANPNKNGGDAVNGQPSVFLIPAEADASVSSARQTKTKPRPSTGSGRDESSLSFHTGSARTAISALPSMSSESVCSPLSIQKKPTHKRVLSQNPRKDSPEGCHCFPAHSILVALLAVLIMSATAYFSLSDKKEPSPGKPPNIEAEIKFQNMQSRLEDLIKKMEKKVAVLPQDSLDVRFAAAMRKLKSECETMMDGHRISVDQRLAVMNQHLEELEESLKRFTDQEFAMADDWTKTGVIEEKQAVAEEMSSTLDDLRSTIAKLIESEIEKHSADGIAKADYALASGGGKVLGHSEVYDPANSSPTSRFLPSTHQHMADVILKPKFGEPGKCLPLKGSDVHLIIRLRALIYPEALTLEHISKSVAYDISSAPKEFKVYGTNSAVEMDNSWDLLGEFSYDATGEKCIQTFNFNREKMTMHKINIVKLHVSSNHGSASHTCIYRVRVHGHE